MKITWEGRLPVKIVVNKASTCISYHNDPSGCKGMVVFGAVSP